MLQVHDDGIGCFSVVTITVLTLFISIIWYSQSLKCEIEFADGTKLQTGTYCYAKAGTVFCGLNSYGSFKTLKCE